MRTEGVPPGAPSPLFVDFATFAHVTDAPGSILLARGGPPLVSETPNATQHQERRLVTVLFADFVGFTSLAEDLDPEELQMLVSGIFEDLAEEALRYDGTIEKFIGDAIFVIFGAPIAHEDDPQRALRCAIGMQKLFAEHAARVKAQLGIELGLRIGIHSGMVVAGAVRAPAEYGVMGDTVNTASRLQQAAAPGEIYVTQATFRLTNREFSFREVGPIEMKGKDRPILAYALTGERTTPRTSIDIQAPLVGRWMELSRLDLAFQSARVGRTEVVLIAGEPGIGKSRLLTEFIGLATSAEDGVRSDAPRVLRWTFSRVNQRSYAGFIEPLLVELRIDPNHQSRALCGRTSANWSWSRCRTRRPLGSSTRRSIGYPTSFATRSSRAREETHSSSKNRSARWSSQAPSRKTRRANGSCASGRPRSRCRRRYMASSRHGSTGCRPARRRRSSSPR